MTRKLWKWLFGISLTLLILFTIVTFGIWALAHGAAAFAATLFPGELEYNPMGPGEFFSNFVGSPMFYAYLVAGTTLTASVVGLVVTRRKKS